MYLKEFQSKLETHITNRTLLNKNMFNTWFSPFHLYVTESVFLGCVIPRSCYHTEVDKLHERNLIKWLILTTASSQTAGWVVSHLKL